MIEVVVADLDNEIDEYRLAQSGWINNASCEVRLLTGHYFVRSLQGEY